MRDIRVSDITMREAAASKALSLSFKEKLEIVKILDRIGVGSIEVEGIESSKVDSLRIKSIASLVKNSTLAVPVKMDDESIEAVWGAAKGAKSVRLQVEAAVSPSCMEYIQRKKADTLIADAAQRLKKQVRVLLRLSNGSQFGMDPDEIKAILHGSHPFARVDGLHYFTGTQKKAPKRIQKELAHLDDFLDELARDCGWHAEMLEYGPGLPVCYFEGEKDSAPEMEQALCGALEQMRYQGPVTLELGRYIAACSGSYATRIVDVKTNLGNDYCIVDGGIHQVNYYGQMLATKRPPVTVLPERNEETSPYTICGALCTTNDILLKEFPLPEPQLGDVLVFDRVGAYSPLEGIALFLSRDLPQVALYSARDGLRRVREAVPTDPWNSER